MPTDEVTDPLNQISCYVTDRQLVEKMLRGEAAAWRSFIDLYGRLIRSRVSDVARSFGLVNDESSIDDGAAEVFGALVANDSAALRAYAGRSSLTTYVAVIATRCATRSFVRRRRRDRDAGDLRKIPDADGIGDPSGRLLAAEERDKIRLLLDELPEKQRQIVERFHFDGQSYADISHAMEIPIGSVGVTLRRAEAKLREKLEPPS